MERLTQRDGQGRYSLPEGVGDLQDVIDRLGRFEDFWDKLSADQAEIIRQMEALRQQEKTKTVQFRELMGKKMMNSSLFARFRFYGLE